LIKCDRVLIPRSVKVSEYLVEPSTNALQEYQMSTIKLRVYSHKIMIISSYQLLCLRSCKSKEKSSSIKIVSQTIFV